MLLEPLFDRFVAESPVSVMARATLEHALDPEALDRLFEDTAQRQYTRELLFSSVVELMALVVCRIRPSLHAAYQARRHALGVSLRAVYDKLSRLEPGLSAALVGHTAARLAPVIDRLDGALPAALPGYRVRILDGNHLAGSEHRLKELRRLAAAPLPGQALVVLDARTMLVDTVVCAEDGHAQERSLVPAVLAHAGPGELWLADRNFCTTDFLFGLCRRGAHFLVRQHAQALVWRADGLRRYQGRVATGQVYEQPVRLSASDGSELPARRISVLLDEPTRDGDQEVHVLTDLPAGGGDALRLADLYRRRWTIEAAFGEMSQVLSGEVRALGYPKAALFAFCVALAGFNVLSAVKAALRSVHGADKVQEELSGYHLAEEIAGTYRGMMIALPPCQWERFRGATAAAMASRLRQWARGVDLERLRKRARGPKKPRPKRYYRKGHNHVATAKILAAREKRQS